MNPDARPVAVTLPARADAAAPAASSDAQRQLLLRDVLARRYPELHRQLARQLRCPEFASECLHEVWLNLGDAEAASVDRPDAYVYRAASNFAMDRLRQNRLWQYVDDSETTDITDVSPGPARLTELRAEIRAVDRAFERLPGRHRDVLVALRLDAHSRSEVAAHYGMSLRTVDTVLRQALDYCAEQTGLRVAGGVGTPRRGLNLHRKARLAAAVGVTPRAPVAKPLQSHRVW